MTPGLTIRGLEKSFHTIPVLKSLDLDVAPGEILGLVGENGAGKSTLMNILGGHLHADAGAIMLDGEPYRPDSARAALRCGLGLVHQELELFPNLSVAENLLIAGFPTFAGCIRRRQVEQTAARLLQQVGLECSPRTLLGHLSAGQQQLVEFARVLATDFRILLLDEPTTSLSRRETDTLYATIHALAQAGKGIILISHQINDVLTHCDRISILRDGRLVHQGPTQEIDVEMVIQKMTGRTVTQLFPQRDRSKGAHVGRVLLDVQSISQPRTLSSISFQIHSGEIVGLFGLVGAGRSELARVLLGLDRCKEGRVLLEGQPVTGSPRRRIQQGLGLVTESRRADGILAEMSVSENLSLVALPRFCRPVTGSIRQPELDRVVSITRQQLSLQSRLNDQQPMVTLSGGNQQKIVVGKWLINDPKVLILDEPSRGIDVGAKADLYQLVQRFADQGRGVLAISSDLEELIGICDRILVMSLGHLTGEFQADEFQRELIAKAAFAMQLSEPSHRSRK